MLGDGTRTDKASPVLIDADTRWVSIAAADYHSAAVKSDGTLWTWGWNGHGQLGDGTTNYDGITTPQKVVSDDTWIAVSTGEYHTVAMKSDGAVWAWGENGNGQLGDGTTTDSYTPVQSQISLYYSLTVLKTGAGAGAVTSDPVGISCGDACSAPFPAGAAVTLTAVPDPYMTFTGWSGGGCSGTGACTVALNATKTVTATFACANKPARIGSAYFATITEAVNAAASGDTIQLQAVDFPEALSINKALTLNGGYNCEYSSRPSSTVVKGNVTIEDGTFTVKMDGILVD
jgi:hypothetical protein